MTAVAVLARGFASVHACLFSFVRKKETACGILRFCSAGSRSPLCVLAALFGYRARRVHFGVVRFFMAISTGTGLRGTRGYEGTGLAARRECVFARAHWLCCAFRGEYVGGCAPPNLRQRVECGSGTAASLDSLHAAVGLGWCVSELAVLARCFASVHACLFSFVRKKETACGILRSCSAGSRSPLCVLAALFGYRARRVHFGFGCFLWRSRRGRGYGERGVTKERGRRRGVSALLRGRIGFVALSAGSTLGLRAPDCAKESSTLWTLFMGLDE